MTGTTGALRTVIHHSTWGPSAMWVWGSNLPRSIPCLKHRVPCSPWPSVPCPLSSLLSLPPLASPCTASVTPPTEMSIQRGIGPGARTSQGPVLETCCQVQHLFSLYLPRLPLKWTSISWAETRTGTFTGSVVKNKHGAVTFPGKKKTAQHWATESKRMVLNSLPGLWKLLRADPGSSFELLEKFFVTSFGREPWEMQLLQGHIYKKVEKTSK